MLRPFAIAAALGFAAFVTATGIPTLRHDWNWPVDATAVPSFFNESIGGWIPGGFGALGTHPTTYLIAVPILLAMRLFGPLGALLLFAALVGYVCACSAAGLARHWNGGAAVAAGVGLFATFNPWVYNEVVAGHLVMVLAYGGTIALFGEMLRGRAASPVRLALALALVESQLQFFIVAMVALVPFAIVTKKWLPPVAGVVLALPSIVGLAAEHGAMLRIPYSLEWQVNQSVAPTSLASLSGYFAGYADRLGVAAAIAVWAMLAVALAGVVVGRRSRAMPIAAAAALLLFCAIAGIRGPLALPYAWIVRTIPESGVFRELYDLAGIFAALLAVLACAGASALRPLRYVALVAGAALPLTWLWAPPSGFWVGAAAYPHPAVSAREPARIALLPAFQPLGLRDDGGDGADPDAHGYPGRVNAVNEYLPSYPVDAALARYERRGDVDDLRALGVSQVVPRPWLVSRSNGRIGLAAQSLGNAASAGESSARGIADPVPLISACEAAPIVALAERLGACAIFFGDAGDRFAPVRVLQTRGDSIDARTDWTDARLAFAAVPALAQGIGGVLTQSRVPYPLEAGRALLADVRGALQTTDGRTLLRSGGGLRWWALPPNVASVVCAGLCELVAQTGSVPALPGEAPQSTVRALAFREILPWLFFVDANAPGARLLRLNERYDAAWTAIGAWRILPHVRVDLAANGWLLGDVQQPAIILVQVTSLLQIAAELCGLACVVWLLKAAVRDPTKRAR